MTQKDEEIFNKDLDRIQATMGVIMGQLEAHTIKNQGEAIGLLGLCALLTTQVAQAISLLVVPPDTPPGDPTKT